MLVNPKYNYRNEFKDISIKNTFNSDHGKTKGFNAVHEFMYLWRHNFKIPDIPVDNDEFMKEADFNSFNKELSLLQQVFGKPFTMKAHIVNWYLKSLSENLKNAIFIHIPRNPVATIRSMMKARIITKGDINIWGSWKPKEYNILKDLDVYHQVAGQIYFIEKTIIEDRKFLGYRYLMFTYEGLCNQPEYIYYKVINKVNKYRDKKIEKEYIRDKKFTISNSKTEFDDNKIEKAYKYFIDKYGELYF